MRAQNTAVGEVIKTAKVIKFKSTWSELEIMQDPNKTQIEKIDSRDWLLVKYKHLVEWGAKKYSNKIIKTPETGIDDLIQVGFEGLQSAIEDFDSTKRNNYVSFFKSRIIRYILQYLRETNVYNRYFYDQMTTLRRFIKQFHDKNGRIPNNFEIAENLKWRLKKVIKVSDHIENNLNSMESIDDKESSIEIESEDISAHNSIEEKELNEKLYDCIAKLSNEDQIIIKMHLDDFNDSDIARVFKKNHMWPSRQIKRINKLLKSCLEINGINFFE